MEFTPRFGLHSQATRLREERTPAGRGPLTARHRPWAEPPSEGLRPPAPPREKTRFRTRQFRHPAPKRVNALFRTLQCPRPERTGIQRWALPSSLAATGGILVSFFSSA